VSQRSVQAVLAAGVENPSLISRWRAEPHLLSAYGIDPAAVDLDALWRFAGITAKLRHQTLRDELPSTFRLISVAGLEIELFAAYASERGERNAPFATTTEDRARDLIAFLDGWLDRGDAIHALLWDMIRHERALTRLGKTAPAVGSSPRLQPPVLGAPSAPAAAAVPRIEGEIVLHEMTSDPRTITRALHDSAPPLTAIPRAPGYLCYWRSEGSQQIAIVQLDELGFNALALVDGTRDVAALSREVDGTERPDPSLLRLLSELVTVGMLSLTPPP
jgi:hypothetical protein